MKCSERAHLHALAQSRVVVSQFGRGKNGRRSRQGMNELRHWVCLHIEEGATNFLGVRIIAVATTMSSGKASF